MRQGGTLAPLACGLADSLQASFQKRSHLQSYMNLLSLFALFNLLIIAMTCRGFG